MPTYLITYPIVGTATIEVEAENEEAAIEAGIELISDVHINDWIAVRRIVTGNVLHASQNEVKIEQIGD